MIAVTLLATVLMGTAPENNHIEKREAWELHPHAAELLRPARLRTAGPGAYFALVLRASDFDHELAPRPYVFRIEGGRVRDLWRGTALAWPLLDAQVVEVDGEDLVCALHRGDSFLRRDSTTKVRRTVVYRWTGFGFERTRAPKAEAQCAERWARDQGV